LIPKSTIVMKKGKIILGAAAFLISAASTLAFKAHSRFVGKQLCAATSAGSSNCTLSTCHTLGGRDLSKAACHTAGGFSLFTLGATGNGTIWTARTTVNNKQCLHPITKWNHMR
jgi:hypothetical protein